MRALLAAHPTVGHTQALRVIGRELRDRGHPVWFAMAKVPRVPAWVPAPAPLRAAAELETQLAQDRFARVVTPSSMRAAFAATRVSATRGYDELDWAIELFTVDAARIAKVIAAAIREHEIDVVVADYLYFGAWLAAESCGVPFVAVYHSGLPFPADGQAPFGSGLPPDAPPAALAEARARLAAASRKVDARLASARRRLGLGAAPRDLLQRPYARALNVLTTVQAFEPPRPRLGDVAAGPLLWAGPCLGSRAHGPDDFPWERLAQDRPSVYVSLGTVFNDQPAIYQALLAGVRRAGAQAVVAAGASLAAVKPAAGPDDIVVGFAPQVPLLERVTAMIGHGGNNSTNEALRAGRPLLVVPFGAEQIANGQRVAALGVGRARSPDALEPAAIAADVAHLLDPSTRARAAAIAAAAPADDGGPIVADAIERVVKKAS